MKKNIIAIAIALFLLAYPVVAATDDFTADGNITVSGVNFNNTTTSLKIFSGSTAESWTMNNGTLTVTNPGSAFNIGSTDSSVTAIIVKNNANSQTVTCAANSTAGTSYVTLPTTSATYGIEPVAQSCTGGSTASTANTSSDSSGGGGGGGGGGGAVSVATPTPTPTPTTSSSGSYSNGSLLRASNSDKVYLIDGGQKRWIPTGDIFTANGYSWTSIKVVDSSVLSGYTEGSNVQKTGTSAVSTASVPEGGLIRAKGGVDVYIAKYVGSKKFKRLILSPSVFNSYKHLKWGDVKEVDASVMDAFATSDLVRAVGDPKVFKLYPAGDTGEKRWVKTASAFTSRGFDWDAIYEINTTDRNSYTEGTQLE